MSLHAARFHLGWLGLSLLAASCGGNLIRLGDEAMFAGAASGGAGAGGTSGAPLGGTGGASIETGGDSLGGQDGGSGGAACPSGNVLASEVLWIGDSWAFEPGTQQETVRDFARAAGAIGPDEEYPSSAVAGASMAMIAAQYDARERGAIKVKILLMDGGTWDPISAQMTGGSASDAIDKSIATFQTFLAKVADDGTVEHIVYWLVPELANIPGVAQMRPRLQQACAESVVPCHFIDLEEVWQAGDPQKYTASNGFLPSAEGGTAIGQKVWDTMQLNCVAQ